MHKVLIDFINHGLMPFTGRGHEGARLIGFWRGTFDARDLRVMLMTGEAGSGKTRILEHILPQIENDGGVVVHVKIYPESTTALLPLIARGITRSEVAQRLLHTETDSTLGAVADSLRRLSRLRATLIVLEDLHLLEGDAVREFATLRAAIADEAVSLLCVARPVELPVRSIIEPYITDELRLDGLRPEEVAELWYVLFNSPVDDDLLQSLMDASVGNALALRSALRGAVHSGVIAPTADGGRWRVGVEHQKFVAVVKRSASAFSEGLVAHLTDAERGWAERLATLGEVFSREAAAVLLNDYQNAVQGLAFRGVIAETVFVPTPVTPNASPQALLAFTNTLVHRHFTGSNAVSVGELVALIAGRAPLYSLIPFQAISRNPASVGADAKAVTSCVEVILGSARSLYNTPDWKLGWALAGYAQSLLDAGQDALDDAELKRWRLNLLNVHIDMNAKDPEAGDRSQVLVEEFLEKTRNPDTRLWAQFRIGAFTQLYLTAYNRDYQRCRATQQEVDELIRSYPALLHSAVYMWYLGTVAQIASALGDEFTMRDTEERLGQVLASAETPEDIRRIAFQRVSPYIITLFSTQQELSARLAQLKQMEDETMDFVPALRMSAIRLYEATGQVETSMTLSQSSVPVFRRHGMVRNEHRCMLSVVFARAYLGGSLDELAEQAEELCQQAPGILRDELRTDVRVEYCMVGLLRGQFERVRQVIQDRHNLPLQESILLALSDPETNPAEGLSAVLKSAIPRTLKGESLLELAGRVFTITASTQAAESWVQAAVQILSQQVIRFRDILDVWVVIRLAEFAGSGGASVLKILEPDIHSAIGNVMTWLAQPQRTLPAIMLATLHLFEGHMDPKQVKLLEKEIKKMQGTHTGQTEPETNAANHDTRTLLTMLGKIEARPVGAAGPVQVRGGRLSTVLGLMVADRMIKNPIDHKAFCFIAAGSDESLDSENARKTMNAAVFRLREQLGQDAILTDGQTPQLNLNRIRVDLLQAHDLLNQVSDAMREGSLIRAYPALMQALEITGGDVPFPGIYDEFFEAARDDFENRLRRLILGVAKELMRMEDTDSAVNLLGRGLQAVPDDEEVTEMLCDVLERTGRRTEAERIRLKTMTEV